MWRSTRGGHFRYLIHERRHCDVFQKNVFFCGKFSILNKNCAKNKKALVLLVFSYSLPSVFPSLCPSLAFMHFLRCELLGYFIDQPSEGFWHCLLSAVCGEACLLFQSLTFIIDGELQVILVSIFVEKHCLQINNFKPKAELIKTNWLVLFPVSDVDIPKNLHYIIFSKLLKGLTT